MMCVVIPAMFLCWGSVTPCHQSQGDFYMLLVLFWGEFIFWYIAIFDLPLRFSLFTICT